MQLVVDILSRFIVVLFQTDSTKPLPHLPKTIYEYLFDFIVNLNNFRIYLISVWDFNNAVHLSNLINKIFHQQYKIINEKYYSIPCANDSSSKQKNHQEKIISQQELLQHQISTIKKYVSEKLSCGFYNGLCTFFGLIFNDQYTISTADMHRCIIICINEFTYFRCDFIYYFIHQPKYYNRFIDIISNHQQILTNSQQALNDWALHQKEFEFTNQIFDHMITLRKMFFLFFQYVYIFL